jgi:hypothetical protein
MFFESKEARMKMTKKDLTQRGTYPKAEETDSAPKPFPGKALRSGSSTIKNQRFQIQIGRVKAEVTFSSEIPEHLRKRFLGILPFTADLHYAKISGESVLFFVPFFVPPQKAVHVNKLSAGTVAYWPNRQQLLIYYGRFEKEDASVMIVGTVSNGLKEFALRAEKTRVKQGQTVEIALMNG